MSVDAPQPDPRRVMVVHGRNQRARDVMFGILSVLGLRPINWDDAIAETGEGTPHNLTAVRAAMAGAQATVVLFTPDEFVRLHPALGDGEEEDATARQPRPNVLFEAGMAFATKPRHTIIVEVGRSRPVTDLHGLNVVRMNGDARGRASLRKRLMELGCEVDEGSTEYLDVPARQDFTAAIELTAADLVLPSSSPAAPAGPASRPGTPIDRLVRIFLDSRRASGPFDAGDLQARLGDGWDRPAVEGLIEELMRQGRIVSSAKGGYRPS